MHGLIFEVLEELVLEKYGSDAWHKIKEIAGCKRKDHEFLRRAFYEDEELFAFVDAAAKLLNVSSEKVLEDYGRFFLFKKLTKSGYSELLKCQGSTLRQWLSNLNALHEYIKRSFPGDAFIAPVFWCEDNEEADGSILLHYYSMRGTVFVPLVVGIVSELAIRQFDLEINMDQTSLQGADGAAFTTWCVSAVDESQQWKLSPKNEVEQEVNFDKVQLPTKCPFSGRKLVNNGGTNAAGAPKMTGQHQRHQHINDDTISSIAVTGSSPSSAKCPFHDESSKTPKAAASIESQSETEETCSTDSFFSEFGTDGNSSRLELQHLTELFPFHILVNDDFSIITIGKKLSKLLNKSNEQIRGMHIGDVVEITRPVLLSSWDWRSLNKLSDQNFSIVPTVKISPFHQRHDQSQKTLLRKKVSMADSAIRFKASMHRLSSKQVLFSLAPAARNVTELKDMGLMLSDLPLASCQRDAVLLGEHIAQETDKAHQLDKLSRRLAGEKDLSNALLNNLLPQKIAEDLRQGKTVEPAFHENVTLFFSDVVGFTSICDQVEPWDVIDMMNQLYSVMDFLASHFDLYKVETVGDSYLCASGLLCPDEYHAEKIANFALAVLECVKHVKSPIDGSPIQLRIGIHTGSCTSGVVGTLTPHYCLFGDMVNTASRHESTGVAGKIQCSSVLYGRLEHFSKSDVRQYNFKARGLVDMKGKGEHHTYWLESATEENAAVNAASLESISNQIVEMLGTKSWRKRRYFARNDETSQHISDSESFGFGSERSSQDRNSIEEIDGDIAEVVIDYSPEKRIDPWKQLCCDTTTDQSELESIIFDELMPSLETCIQKHGTRLQVIQQQLRAFVSSIADVYMSNGEGLKLLNIVQTVLRCNCLWEARDTNETSPYGLGTIPWDHFVLVFSAFVHRVKHTRSTNATLVNEKHLIAQMYEGLTSCQERRSVDFAFSLMEDKFGQLYDEITYGCPNFRSMVRKAVIATDLEHECTIHKMLGRCEELNAMEFRDEHKSRERNEANIGLILAVATVGQYTQSLDQFLLYSGEEYEKATKASKEDSESWYFKQVMFMKDVLLPMIDELLTVLPRATYLEEGAMENIAFWDKNGGEWMVACRVKNAKLHGAIEGIVVSEQHVDMLVSANVGILEPLLADVMSCRNGHETKHFDNGMEEAVHNPYEEIQMRIEMKKSIIKSENDTSDLTSDVSSELRQFVMAIASGYEDNAFHNFSHASHVAHLTNLLLKGIHSTEEPTDGIDIVHDPLARFAIVLSALVHDIGHTGVPNGQIAYEKPELAEKYKCKSLAEQNSIDIAWKIIMSPRFKHLQHCLFESKEDKGRFRQILVNCVMATDIFDQDLKALRQSRWNKVFSEDESLRCGDEEERHYKATIVMEHIMQASDVAHTMQDWEIYRQWNENLFREMHDAYTNGRSRKDPSAGWYEGELWFFDNWVVSLAQNLKDCGVMDIVGDQMLRQARSNRLRWQLEGKRISQEMCARVKSNTRKLDRKSSGLSSSPSSSEHSSSSASSLASQMVTEAESLSKVMARYKRKYETVLGNLIALTYKGQDCPIDFQFDDLASVHNHFKEQEWYRSHQIATE